MKVFQQTGTVGEGSPHNNDDNLPWHCVHSEKSLLRKGLHDVTNFGLIWGSLKIGETCLQTFCSSYNQIYFLFHHLACYMKQNEDMNPVRFGLERTSYTSKFGWLAHMAGLKERPAEHWSSRFTTVQYSP
jgi:hypothetical protein